MFSWWRRTISSTAAAAMSMAARGKAVRDHGDGHAHGAQYAAEGDVVRRGDEHAEDEEGDERGAVVNDEDAAHAGENPLAAPEAVKNREGVAEDAAKGGRDAAGVGKLRLKALGRGEAEQEPRL